MPNLKRLPTEQKLKRGLLKKGEAPRRVLTSDEQIQVVHWLGEFKKVHEIINLVKEKFQKDISVNAIKYYEFHPVWGATLEKDRQKYCAELFRVELANERRRIEELEQIYFIQKGKGKLPQAVKTLHEIYEQVQKPQAYIQNNYQMNIYKEMSEEDFEKRELELLEKRRKIKEGLDASGIGETKEINGDRGTRTIESLQIEQERP